MTDQITDEATGEELVELELRQSGAWLWLNRGAQHNALNPALMSSLSAQINIALKHQEVRYLVLAGRGKNFCAGADLRWMREAGAASTEENERSARQLANLLRQLAQAAKPVIARVHGLAIGGGLGLAAACDICLATSASQFATSEVRLGLVPATIAPYVLRAIGARQAGRYFLSAERFDGESAQAMGLVHEICSDIAELDEQIAQIGAALGAGGPQAIHQAKQLINTVAGRAIDDAVINDTIGLLTKIRSQPEAQEGLAAFLAKRPAVWSADRT